MKTTLENRKKAVVDSSRSALKRKNIIEEGRASGSRMKREQESTNLRAQKMMKGRMEPFKVPTMVRAVPTMVHEAKQITEIPQMTTPQKTQLREQRQEVPQITSP